MSQSLQTQPQVPLLFSGQRRWAPPGERKASCLAPGSVAPHPKAGPPRPLLYYSSFPFLHPIFLGFHDVLRVPPPLAISNLWSQCLAALHSWLTFPPKKLISPQWSVGWDPHGFPNPVIDTRVSHRGW